jgi:soluble lytic murein transglycosylase
MASFTRSRFRAWPWVWLALAALFSDLALADREQDRETFRQGWAAAARGDQARHDGRDHGPAGLPADALPGVRTAAPAHRPGARVVAEQFLARHRDWSFAANLETVWLRSLARRGDYEALLRHGRESADAEVRCHLAGPIWPRAAPMAWPSVPKRCGWLGVRSIGL